MAQRSPQRCMSDFEFTIEFARWTTLLPTPTTVALPTRHASRVGQAIPSHVFKLHDSAFAKKRNGPEGMRTPISILYYRVACRPFYTSKAAKTMNIGAYLLLAFRQHVLERAKAALMLVLLAAVWCTAAFPNPLGTSSLFWRASNWEYNQTCLALGLLCAVWLWISLLMDTGQKWLVESKGFWPALDPSFKRTEVFALSWIFLSLTGSDLRSSTRHACFESRPSG